MANYRHPTPKTEPPAVCTVLDELCIAGTDPANCTVTYMGYPLLLSPAETRLLLALLARSQGEPDSDPSNPSVRMCVKRINDKTREIGGRDLVVRGRGGAYRVNPQMS